MSVACRLFQGAGAFTAGRFRCGFERSTGVAVLLLWALAVSVAPPAASAQVASNPVDGVPAFIARLQKVVEAGAPGGLAALATPDADVEGLSTFEARWITTATTKVTVRERDRVATATGQRVLLEAFLEAGPRGRLATWQADLTAAADGDLRVTRLSTVTAVDGLYRLALDTTRQFQVTNLHVTAEDIDLVVPRGTAFVATAGSGPTAFVVVGRGEMTFKPAPETERGQIRLMAGEDTLRTSFDGVFIRVPPAEFDAHVTTGALEASAVDASALRAAQVVFGEEVGKSFSVDLGDLGSEAWSLLPTTSDFLAEIRTRRFGTLTYAHANNQPEDITLFDRARRHNLSVYASTARLAAARRLLQRGRRGGLRRTRLQRRRDLLARTAVARGPGTIEAPRAELHAGGAHLAPGRTTQGAIRDERQVRTPAAAARAEPGHLRLEPPGPGEPRHRVQHHGGLRGPPRAAADRARGHRRRPDLPARGKRRARTGTKLRVQQPDLLVPPGHVQRLRDGTGADDGAAWVRRRVHGRPGGGLTGAGAHRERRGASAVRVLGDAARALPGVSGLASRPRRDVERWRSARPWSQGQTRLAVPHTTTRSSSGR